MLYDCAVPVVFYELCLLYIGNRNYNFPEKMPRNIFDKLKMVNINSNIDSSLISVILQSILLLFTIKKSKLIFF